MAPRTAAHVAQLQQRLLHHEPTIALQVKGKAVVQVAVEYTVHHDGAIDSAWEVDARKALPAPLPKFMYWCALAAYSMYPA